MGGGEWDVVGSSRADSGGSKDRKSTRLNSSHLVISYAVFCLKKKKITTSSGRSASPTIMLKAHTPSSSSLPLSIFPASSPDILSKASSLVYTSVAIRHIADAS